MISKLVRDKEDPKYMYLHIHQNYFDIVNNGWSKGWAEAKVNMLETMTRCI